MIGFYNTYYITHNRTMWGYWGSVATYPTRTYSRPYTPIVRTTTYSPSATYYYEENDFISIPEPCGYLNNKNVKEKPWGVIYDLHSPIVQFQRFYRTLLFQVNNNELETLVDNTQTQILTLILKACNIYT